MTRKSLMAVLPFALVGGCGGLDTGSATFEVKTSDVVRWHPNQAPALTGVVEGATATIKRGPQKIKFEVRTHSLVPGRVYTAHAYVFNNPDACTVKNPSLNLKCTPPDLNNPAVAGSLIHLDSITMDEDGEWDYKSDIFYGDGSTCYPGQVCNSGVQSPDAGILLCIRDHGPELADETLRNNQHTLFNGGCPPNVCKFAQFMPDLAPQLN